MCLDSSSCRNDDSEGGSRWAVAGLEVQAISTCGKNSPVVTRFERPLSVDEQLHLRARLANARGESGRAVLKAGGASAVVCGVLAAATLLVSDAPRWVVLLFWTLLWLLFTLWIGLPWRKLMRGQIPILEDGLRTSRVRVIRLQSSRVVE